VSFVPLVVARKKSWRWIWAFLAWLDREDLTASFDQAEVISAQLLRIPAATETVLERD
jgi:hypothetical protein